MKLEREGQEAFQNRVLLERERVFQTPERMESHDQFQVLERCWGRKLQVARILPTTADSFHNKCLMQN